MLSGISVFPAATAEVSPTDITAGPDGNLWFTEAIGDAIGMINPTTHAITQIPLPSSVGFEGADQVTITAGPDGNLWFADYDGNTIGMIDPKTDAISVFPVPTPGAGLMDITAGPDGNLWFTEKAANQIGMINPTTHAISEFPVPTANSWLVDIAPGPDGNLWFTEQVGNAIGMIDPTTHAITEFPLPTADSSPSAIAAGPDGNLWFVASGAIGTIDPTTHAITEFPVPNLTPGSTLLDGSITTGSDGNLWFGYFNGDEVGSIDPTTDAITVYPVPVDQPGLGGIGGPAAIAVGPDGNLWITLQNANEIGVFDPQTLSPQPIEAPPPANPGPTPPPIVGVPPIGPLAPPVPASPGMTFGFTLTFEGTSGQTAGPSGGTVTVALVDHPGGAALTVTAPDGVDTFSGIALKKLGKGPVYKLIDHDDRQTASLRGRPATASTRIGTEETITVGKGKHKHVIGFEIELGAALDPTLSRDVANPTVPQSTRQTGQTIVQPVGLLVDDFAAGGTANLTLTGTASFVRRSRIVVIAWS